jgi:hypothetical protein
MPQLVQSVLRAPSSSVARSTADLLPLRRPRRRPPDCSRVNSLGRRVVGSPRAQSPRIGVFGDDCAGWQRARDAQRPRRSF